MGKVRENCRVIPTRLAPPSPGIYVEEFDHPNLLLALRSLASYVDWVDNKLLIIASKWIEEHREEVIDGMTEQEKNDIGAAIEKAFSVIEASGWYKAQVERGKSFNVEEALAQGRANPLWIKQSERIDEILSKFQKRR